MGLKHLKLHFRASLTVHDFSTNRYLTDSEFKFHSFSNPHSVSFALCQDIEWLEFFAGTGNLTRVMRSAQCKSVRFDILDHECPDNRRSNFMDLSSPSGFAFLGSFESQTCMVPIIIFHPDELGKTNMIEDEMTQISDLFGSSKIGNTLPSPWSPRCFRMPSGPEVLFNFKNECGHQLSLCLRFDWFWRVQLSITGKLPLGEEWVSDRCDVFFMARPWHCHYDCINYIIVVWTVSIRSCLMIALTTVLGGIWSLEQPSGALTEFYPAFRETIQNIFTCGGPHAVGA